VVTLEDVLEQIVGKIFDESDHAPSFVSEAVGVHFMDGTASLRQVEELFDVDFEEYEGVNSVGDLISQLAGQIPIAGSVVVCEGVRFKVLAANDRRVIRVSVELVDIESSSDD
jgi:CBS domain containing-hemolysin-like protein